MEKASRATDKKQPLTLFLEPNAGRFDRWFTFSGVHDLHEKRYALGRVPFHSQKQLHLEPHPDVRFQFLNGLEQSERLCEGSGRSFEALRRFRESVRLVVPVA